MPWIEKRSKGFLVRYRIAGGKQFSHFCHTAEEARIYKAKCEFDLARDIHPETGSSIKYGIGLTTGDAIEEYHEWSDRKGRADSTYRRDIDSLIPFLTGVSPYLVYIDAEDLNSFLFKTDYATASSYNKAVAALRSFFGAMHELGHIKDNPADKLKYRRIPRRLPSIFTQDEASKILGSLPKHYKLFGLFIAVTGCRLSEAIDLDWSNVKLPIVTIRHPKEGHDKTLVLPPSLCEALTAIEDKTGLVFRNRSGRRLCKHSACKTIKDAAERVGIDRATVHWHKFRHTAASRFVLTLPVPVVQSLLGHSRITTTQMYINVAGAHLEQAAAGPMEDYAKDLVGNRSGQLHGKSPEKPDNTVSHTKRRSASKRRS